jgi:hypothetical protein
MDTPVIKYNDQIFTIENLLQGLDTQKFDEIDGSYQESGIVILRCLVETEAADFRVVFYNPNQIEKQIDGNKTLLDRGVDLSLIESYTNFNSDENVKRYKEIVFQNVFNNKANKANIKLKKYLQITDAADLDVVIFPNVECFFTKPAAIGEEGNMHIFTPEAQDCFNRFISYGADLSGADLSGADLSGGRRSRKSRSRKSRKYRSRKSRKCKNSRKRYK